MTVFVPALPRDSSAFTQKRARDRSRKRVFHFYCVFPPMKLIFFCGRRRGRVLRVRDRRVRGRRRRSSVC